MGWRHLWGHQTTVFALDPSQGYEGFSMSGSEEAKKDAERQVSDELASQPKQNGAGTGESKERRADAEKKLTDTETREARTK
jgi:hypothetical protein